MFALILASALFTALPSLASTAQVWIAPHTQEAPQLTPNPNLCEKALQREQCEQKVMVAYDVVNAECSPYNVALHICKRRGNDDCGNHQANLAGCVAAVLAKELRMTPGPSS